MASDAVNDEDRWMHRLTPQEVEDVDNALRHSQRAGHSECATMTKEDFPIQIALASTLKTLLERVENDMGMFVIRGVPTERYTKQEMRQIFWGLGLHLGTGVSQSSSRDMLGDVNSFGNKHSPHTAGGRGYMSNVHLPFHTDSADVVALIVLRTPKSGGQSIICSSVAVRNEISHRRPDLLEVLEEDFYWSWRGNSPPGYGQHYRLPVLLEQDGKFSSRFVPTHISSAQDFEGIPKLTSEQKEALELVDEITNDPKFHFALYFEPGDMQFLNNHICYHARTEFQDDDTEETKRHLFRMWLAPKNSRQLCPEAKNFFQETKAGAVRSGFPSRNGEKVFETIMKEG